MILSSPSKTSRRPISLYTLDERALRKSSITGDLFSSSISPLHSPLPPLFSSLPSSTVTGAAPPPSSGDQSSGAPANAISSGGAGTARAVHRSAASTRHPRQATNIYQVVFIF